MTDVICYYKDESYKGHLIEFSLTGFGCYAEIYNKHNVSINGEIAPTKKEAYSLCKKFINKI